MRALTRRFRSPIMVALALLGGVFWLSTAYSQGRADPWPTPPLLPQLISGNQVQTEEADKFNPPAPGESQSPTPSVRDPLRKTASWNWPDVAIYQEQLQSYLEQRDVSDALQQRVEEHWQQTSSADRGPEFLDRLLDIGCMIEPRMAELCAQLRSPTAPPVYPGEVTWLTSDVPGWLQDTIRLACGRTFGQRRMYDEALEALAGLEPSTVCDPATLLFYRATAEHHLLKKDECLANVELLLERQAELPSRFARLAELMKADIEPLAPDSLDEIARLMQDVHRRLDLGRAGKRVRDQEQQIVDKLDKMIEQIEEQMEQQRQQQQQQSAAPSSGQAKPMEDSQIAGGGGPGNIDQRDNGDRAGWGNLPPAERQEALQRLTEELPSHYREVIEGYFRQLAKESR